MRRAIAVLVALAAACSAPRPVRRLVVSDEFRYQGHAATFPTGLRAIVVQTAEAGRYTVTVSYSTGAADDPPGKEGLAWVTARLSGAARTRGGVSRDERLFAAGALASEEVRSDEVVFRATVRAAQLRDALAIEADRLRDPLAGVTEESFREAREALTRAVEEARTRADGVAAQRQLVVAAALAGTRYGRGAATPASVAALTLEDVRAWAAEHLSPERAIAVITGPRPPVEVVQELVGTFQELATTRSANEPRVAPVVRPRAQPSPPAAPSPARIEGPSPRLWIAWRLPGDAAGLTASAYHARDVVERVLPRVRSDDRVRGVDVRLEAGLDASALVVQVDLRDANDAGPVEDRVRAALANRWDDPSREGAGWSDRFWWLERGIGDDAARLVRATGEVDPLAVIRAQARQQSASYAEYLSTHLASDRAVRLVAAPAGAVAQEPEPEVEPQQLVSSLADLELAAPGPDRVRELVAPPGVAAAVHRRLPNGLEVVIVPRGALPIVEARLLVAGELPDGPGAAAILPSIAVRVTTKAWSLAGNYECVASPVRNEWENLAFVERAAASRLSAMLARLSCWTKRKADAGRIDDAVQATRQEPAVLRSPRYRAAAELVRAAVADPRVALPTSTTAGITGRAAAAWLDRTLRPERSILLIVGRVDLGPALMAEIEERFGGWKPATPRVPSPQVALRTPDARRVVVVHAPGSRRVGISLAVRTPLPASRDDAAMRALRYLLFQRLHAALTPLGAEVGTALLGRPDAPVLQAWIDAEPARAGEAVGRTLAALEQLSARPPLAAEATLARWFAALEEAYRFDTGHETADALEQAFFERRPLEAWDALAEGLATVDPGRLHAAARSLAVGREAVVLQGDARKLAPALQRAGIVAEVVEAPPER